MTRPLKTEDLTMPAKDFDQAMRRAFQAGPRGTQGCNGASPNLLSRSQVSEVLDMMLRHDSFAQMKAKLAGWGFPVRFKKDIGELYEHSKAAILKYDREK